MAYKWALYRGYDLIGILIGTEGYAATVVVGDVYAICMGF